MSQKKRMMTNNMQQKSSIEMQQAMKEALDLFLKDRSSAKEFSLCMQESTQWLKEREK